jgi:hypothetical protein
MKSFTLFLFFALFSIVNIFAQNTYNLEFFTQETPPFTIYINGIKQHVTPTNNVRVEGFVQPILKLRVEFIDNSDSVSKTLYLPEESSEVSYQIKSTKRGYKVRAFSFVPLNETPQVVESPNFVVVPYATVPVVSETTTTTTTTSGNGTGINVGINGEGVGINVSLDIGGLGGVYEETTTTTTSGLDSDAIHSPNEHFGIWNYLKGIETIPQFYEEFTKLKTE